MIIWKKSSHSAAENCVEVGNDGAVIMIRDTKNREGGHLTLSLAQWTALKSKISN